MYEFVVSGFRNNACVLKLKRMFFLSLCNAGSKYLDVTPMTLMNKGCENGEGERVGLGMGLGLGIQREFWVGRDSGRGFHWGCCRSLDLVATQRWDCTTAILLGEFRWAVSSSQQPIP
jgi:hypothetical protein